MAACRDFCFAYLFFLQKKLYLLRLAATFVFLWWGNRHCKGLTFFCADLRVEASITRRFGVVTTPDFVTRPTEMLTEKTISDLTSGSASGGGANLKSINVFLHTTPPLINVFLHIVWRRH